MTPSDPGSMLHAILTRGPVIPVVTLDDAELGVDVAHALVAGGVRVIELTLRTPRALAVIRAIAAAVPDVAVGAGTVLDPVAFAHAVDAGASFIVSPGATPSLLDFAARSGVSYLPGVATVSEAMSARERGFRALKLFPATAVGGTTLLSAVAPVLPDLAFCPTGGITVADAPAFLACSNVVCIGGSWLTPKALLAARDLAAITRLAAATASLRV